MTLDEYKKTGHAILAKAIQDLLQEALKMDGKGISAEEVMQTTLELVEKFYKSFLKAQGDTVEHFYLKNRRNNQT